MLTSKVFASNYVQFLNKVVREANDPEIRSFRELLKKLVGPVSHVAVIEEILSWLPFSKRKDGLIYKSSIDIAKQRGLSKRTVDRAVQKLQEIGFTREIKKANGVPTAHYGLDMSTFSRAIAKVLHVHELYVFMWMNDASLPDDGQSGNIGDGAETVQNGSPAQIGYMHNAPVATFNVQPSQNENRQSGDLDVANLATSITAHTADSKNRKPESEYNKTPLPTHRPVLSFEVEKIAQALGTSKSNVSNWLNQYKAERVLRVTEAALSNPQIRNKGAWVREALKKGFEVKTTTVDSNTEALTYNISTVMQNLSAGMRMR
jgi:transposase